MALLIDNDVSERVVTVPEAIDAVEAAFTQLGEGEAAFYPREDIVSPTTDRGDVYCWGHLLGAIREPPRLALRFKSDILVWEDETDNVTRDKFNVEPGTYLGFILLVDTSTGAVIGLINDGVPQHVRVGATAGVACEYLAREDAETVGMIGSGGMARTYAEAFATVRDLSEVTVYSPTPSHREAYADEMSETLGVDVAAVDSTREAVRGADIVAACTDASHPVYDDPSWLEDGVFLVDVSPVEVDEAVLEAVDHRYTTTNRSYNDQIIGAEVTAEEFHANHGGPHDWQDTDDIPLADVLLGECPMPAPDDTVYYRNRSAGVQFAAVGNLIHEKATERGLGTVVPLEWFQQDVRD